MIIALFPNTSKKSSRNLALGIKEFLGARGVQVVSHDEEAAHIDVKPISEIDPKEIDFIISMGGDGTILRQVHKYPHLDAPYLGINLGHLGFMADVPISDIYPSLLDLLNGAFKVERRIMMKGITSKGEECFALNEMVVHRARNPSLVELAIHVDGMYLNTFLADGIIIATPSGSTAYSLAAGGPILSPGLQAFVITPVSPHTISNRPMVLMSEKEITIQYLSHHEPVEIHYDGIPKFSMTTGDVFKMCKSDREFKLVNLLRHDYYSTLRKKLNWTGKLK